MNDEEDTFEPQLPNAEWILNQVKDMLVFEEADSRHCEDYSNLALVKRYLVALEDFENGVSFEQWASSIGKLRFYCGDAALCNGNPDADGWCIACGCPKISGK